MRQINIFIDQRIGVPTDNIYVYNNTFYTTDIYQFISMRLNYSILNSDTLSTLILSMNQPQSDDNVLRSGQPITVTDNGMIVFQGVLLTIKYNLLEMSENSQGGLFAVITLAPSIYQLTITPVVFDSTQSSQIQQLTGVNINSILTANVTQSISTSSLLSYIISNTDYSNYFGKTISSQDLASNVYLMTSSEQMRDKTLRQSIDYYNCVLYQQEDGTIIIRQLDSSIEAPFDLDLSNQYDGLTAVTSITINGTLPVVPLLTYEYLDNAYNTPAVISNYAMLPPNLANSAMASSCILTYAPNPKFFPRLKQLQLGGWFTGQLGVTQINNNILSDPTTATALNTFFKEPDQYMIVTKASGVSDQSTAAYQALLTAKQTGNAIANYANLIGKVSLDDRNIPTNLGNIIGSIIQIQNCDLNSGIISNATRSYSSVGSYLEMEIAPLGSFTGYWKNSTFTPSFD